MKKTLALTLSIILSITTFTGCGKSDNENSDSSDSSISTEATEMTQTDAIVTDEESTSSQTSASADTTSSAVQTSPDAQTTDETSNETSDSQYSKKTITELRTMFPFMADDGRAKETTAQNDAAFTAMGFDLKELTLDNIKNIPETSETTTIFKIQVKNDEPLTIEDNLCCRYVSVSDDFACVLIFGDVTESETTEINTYAPQGKLVSYYAMFIRKNDNAALLLPVVAGSEETGYYFIRPNLAFAEFDVSSIPVLPSDTPIGTDLSESQSETNTAQ